MRSLPLIVALVGLVAAAALFGYTYYEDQQAQQVQTQQAAQQALATVQSRLSRYETLINSGQALSAAQNNDVTPRSWRDFFATLDVESRYPGLYGLVYIEAVQRSEVSQFLSKFRSERFDSSATIRPGGRRDLYCVIRFGEPAARNDAQVGLDVCNDSGTRKLLEDSRDSGEPVMTGRNKRFSGGSLVVLYQPVYSNNARLQTALDRKNALIGWVGAPILVQDMLAGSLDDNSPLDLQIFDAPEPNRDEILFDRDGGIDVATEGFSGRATYSTNIDVAGRQWHLIFSQPYEMNSSPIIAGLAGVLIALLLAYVVHRASRERVKIQRRAEELTVDLKEQSDFITSFTENISEGIFRWDPNFKMLFCNPALAGLLGYKNTGLLQKAKTPFRVTDEEQWSNLMFSLKRAGHFRDKEFEFVRHDGSRFWGLISVESYRGDDGKIAYFDGALRDITERKHQEQKIEKQAFEDALTGLPNRLSFNKAIDQSMRRAKRTKKPLALLFIDMDKFKMINDTIGHDAGDSLLKDVAKRATASVRQDDIVVRLGGDEFVVILPEVNVPDDTARVAQKLLESLSQPYHFTRPADDATEGDESGEMETGQTFEMDSSPSIGIAVYPHDAQDADSLLKAADGAMFEAKRNGRANFRFASDAMTEKADEKLALEGEIQEAMDADLIEIRYQPYINPADGKLIGLHAYPFWNHPERGLLEPEDFLPIIRPTALITPLSEMMVRHIFADLAFWQQAGVSHLTVTHSVESYELKRGNLPKSIARSSETSGIPPQQIAIEFAEDAELFGHDDAHKVIKMLADKDITLSLGNYGYGCGLDAIKRYPIHRAALHPELVAGMKTDENARSMAQGICGAAKGMNLTVAARSVHEKETGLMLAKLGCKILEACWRSESMRREEVAALVEQATGTG